jgi:glycine cleavage system H protein
MPVSDKVTEVNKELLQSPILINSDPYGKGWMIRIEITDLNESTNLLSAEQYKKNINF